LFSSFWTVVRENKNNLDRQQRGLQLIFGGWFKRMEMIEVKSLIWSQKGKLYIIYENVMWILGILRFKSIHLLFYTCMHIIHIYISNDSNAIQLLNCRSRKKLNILDMQHIASQWGLQLIFRMHNSDHTPQGVENINKTEYVYFVLQTMHIYNTPFLNILTKTSKFQNIRFLYIVCIFQFPP
jgi:hypothetical protein